MMNSLISVVLILSAYTPVGLTACIEYINALESAEQCMEPLKQPTSDMTLLGTLTTEQKDEYCAEYNRADACLTTQITNLCEPSTEVTHIANNIRDGVGQLCTDEAAFQEYTACAEHYVEHAQNTSACGRAFDEGIHNILSVPEGIENPCLFYDDWGTCMLPVRASIGRSCGEASLELFDALLKTKVPSFLEGHCPESDVFSKPDTSSAPELRFNWMLPLLAALMAVLIPSHIGSTDEEEDDCSNIPAQKEDEDIFKQSVTATNNACVGSPVKLPLLIKCVRKLDCYDDCVKTPNQDSNEQPQYA